MASNAYLAFVLDNLKDSGKSKEFWMLLLKRIVCGGVLFILARVIQDRSLSNLFAGMTKDLMRIFSAFGIAMYILAFILMLLNIEHRNKIVWGIFSHFSFLIHDMGAALMYCAGIYLFAVFKQCEWINVVNMAVCIFGSMLMANFNPNYISSKKTAQ